MSTPRHPKQTKAKATTPKVAAHAKSRKAKVPAKPVIDIDLNAAPAAAPAIEVPTQTAPTPAPAKPMSGLDAAALILKDAGEPMDVQTLLTRILERALWKTQGKTPAATLYSAIIREIRAKGTDSRFKKVDRGQFAAAG